MVIGIEEGPFYLLCEINLMTSWISSKVSRFLSYPSPSPLYFIRHGKKFEKSETRLEQFKNVWKKYGDFIDVRKGLRTHSYWCFHPALIEEVMENPKRFPKYPFQTEDLEKLQALIGRGVIATSTNANWKSQKMAITPYLSPKKIKNSVFPSIQKAGERFLAECREAFQKDPENVNISVPNLAFSGRVIFSIVAPHVSLSGGDFEEIRSSLNKGVDEFHLKNFKEIASTYFSVLSEMAKKWIAIERAHIEEGPSLFADLQAIAQRDANNAHDEETSLIGSVVNLLVAGFETTSTTLNWLFYLVGQSPIVQDRLIEEIHALVHDPFHPTYEELEKLHYLDAVISETMRLYPVLWFNIRYTDGFQSLGNDSLLPKSEVMLLTFIANRHPSFWKNPDLFAPERHLDGEGVETYPFGKGKRSCPGNHLALTEVKMAVLQLLSTFSIETKYRVHARGGVLTHPDRDITLKLKSRSSTMTTQPSSDESTAELMASHDIYVEASSSNIWKGWGVDRWHEWNAHVKKASMEGAFIPGKQITILLKNNEQSVKVTLETVEENGFTDVAELPAGKLITTHQFEKGSEKTLKITHTITFIPSKKDSQAYSFFKEKMWPNMQSNMITSLNNFASLVTKI